MFAKRNKDSSEELYDVRCFTPLEEIDFCGHGIMAVALALKKSLRGPTIFRAPSGKFAIVHQNSLPGVEEHTGVGEVASITLLIPSYPPDERLLWDHGFVEALARAIGVETHQIIDCVGNEFKDIIIELDQAVPFSAIDRKIDAVALHNACPPDTRAQIVTSRGSKLGVDCLKRVFWCGVEGELVCRYIYTGHELTPDRRPCHRLNQLRADSLLGRQAEQECYDGETIIHANWRDGSQRVDEL